jgi:hypothetical protein
MAGEPLRHLEHRIVHESEPRCPDKEVPARSPEAPPGWFQRKVLSINPSSIRAVRPMGELLQKAEHVAPAITMARQT